MDPIQVTIDPDGMVTVIIVDSDGSQRRGSCGFKMQKLCKRSFFLDSMPSAIEAGGAEKTTPGKLGSRWCVLPAQLTPVAEHHRRGGVAVMLARLPRGASLGRNKPHASVSPSQTARTP
jgi:hypothetical protein